MCSYVPKGQMKIARRFIAGQRCSDVLLSPVGTIESFSRPYGTQSFFIALFPSNKLPDYFQSLLTEQLNRTIYSLLFRVKS
jgi:hypothetical protein